MNYCTLPLSLYSSWNLIMGTFETYLIAVRPWSFSASMMPVLLGSALAYPSLRAVSYLVLFLTCISTLCVHAAANLFNTYVEQVDLHVYIELWLSDFLAIMITFMALTLHLSKRNINVQQCPIMSMIEGLLRPNDVVRLGLILYAIGTVAFLCLTHFSPAKEPYLALIFFGALPLSFLYTGGIGKCSLIETFIC
jgi:menadiol prenyltransferase